MLDSVQKLLANKKIKQLADVRNIGLYIFCIIVLAISWSGVRTLQNNYDLQKKVSALKQQNSVLALQNENAELQNNFYQTNEYLDLAARQNLGLAAPGETVLLIPKSVALKYVDQSVATNSNNQPKSQSKVMQNFEAWRDFLLGRKPL